MMPEIKYPCTLSIDLGASYTKIAYREDCTPSKTRRVTKNARVMMLGHSSLIPSLAVQGKKGRWFFGHQAAKMLPGPSQRIYQNWKANLFRPENDEETASAVIVTQQFLRWLREKVEESHIALEEAEVRVALPAFENSAEKASVVARCMKMAGWDCPAILKVTEPYANVLGLFTAGQNHLWKDKFGGVFLDYGQMFGMDSGYVKRARGTVLGDARGGSVYRVLVIDIGAFTTDVAALAFDVRSEQDGLTKVEQDSYAVGVINQLDRPLFKAIEKRHGFSVGDVSFEQSEQMKMDLYQGKSHSLLIKGKGGFEIGGETDDNLVKKYTKEFAREVCMIVGNHIEIQKPDEVRLTGGGSLIGTVTAEVKTLLRAKRVRVQSSDGFEAALKGSAKWRVWNDTGEALVRLATAVGGASVILQAPVLPPHQRVAKKIKLPEPVRDYTECFCRGGNKDCCFCGGRGYYRNCIGE